MKFLPPPLHFIRICLLIIPFLFVLCEALEIYPSKKAFSLTFTQYLQLKSQTKTPIDHRLPSQEKLKSYFAKTFPFPMFYLSSLNPIALMEINLGGIYHLDDFKNFKGSSLLLYGTFVTTSLPITYNLHNPFGYYQYALVYLSTRDSMLLNDLISLNLEARYVFNRLNSKNKLLAFLKILVGNSYDNFKIITHKEYSQSCYWRYCFNYVSRVWYETIYSPELQFGFILEYPHNISLRIGSKMSISGRDLLLELITRY